MKLTNGTVREQLEESVKPNIIRLADAKSNRYLATRGISKETAEKYGVYSAEHYIRDAGRAVECVAFPYKNGTKFRATDRKAFAYIGQQDTMFGIDLVDFEKSKDIIITEGEIDALSLSEVGFHNVVSIPGGAKAKLTPDTPLEFLWNSKDVLEKAERIILALDGDKPGEVTAEEIARRLGFHRCWQVKYQEGFKDANDILTKIGQEETKALVTKAEPWPVSGLYDAQHFYKEVLDARINGLDPGYSTGYPLLDKYYTIPEGQLTVVTGTPASGKSEFIDQLMVNLAEQSQWRFSICSFENEPRVHIAKLISKRVRKGFWNGAITEPEFDEAYNWTAKHFSFLYHRDGSLSDLDSILSRLKAAVLRYGIKGAVIDPYNYILRDRDKSETEWISDMLTKVKTFCMSHGVHVWFVAHPTKLQKSADGSYPVPKGYDISGSAAWFAKADMGITLHRPDETQLVQVHVWKVRFQWNGKHGMASLLYNPDTTRYSDESDPFGD